MLGLNSTYYGLSLTFGGPGVCEAVRETFHERELMPNVSTLPSVFVADASPYTGPGALNRFTYTGDHAGSSNPNQLTGAFNLGHYLSDIAQMSTDLRDIANG